MKRLLYACLLGILAGGPAAAQSEAPSTPPKPEHARLYLLLGANRPDFDNLNAALQSTPYPQLTGEATQFGVGFGGGPGLDGRFTLLAEMRGSRKQRQLKDSRAYTRTQSATVSLLAQYEVARSARVALSLFGGPELTTVNLTLKAPRPDGSTPSDFNGFLASGPDRRQLTQYLYGATAGVQTEWRLQPKVSSSGRQYQPTIGLRVQYSAPLMGRSRWRTEEDNWLKADKLTRPPKINPGGLSASLVLGGVFGRP